MRTTFDRLLVTVALIAAVAACSSGERPSLQGAPAERTVTAIRDATASAGPLRYEGTVVQDDRTGTLSGVSGAQPRRGEATVPVFAAATVVLTTVRWVEDRVYVERVPVETRSATPAGALLERASTDLPWAVYAWDTIAAAVLTPVDPLRLLDSLASVGAGLEAVGEEDVDGVPTTRYRVAGGGSGAASRSSTAELWVDVDLRLRRVRAETPVWGVSDYTVTELGAALVVEPPPADLIADLEADLQELAGVKPAGPYEPVRSGTTEGVRWTLLRAPGTSNGFCWRFEADPPLTQVSEAFAPFPEGGRCIGSPTASADVDLDERVGIAVDADAVETSYDALVLVLPPDVVSVEMAGPGGGLTPVEIDPASGTAVWVSPSDRPGLLAVVRNGGGQTAMCAPGTITEVDDLVVLDADDVANLRALIWSCLPG